MQFLDKRLTNSNDIADQAPGLLKNDHPGMGGSDGPPTSDDQAHAELSFKRLQTLFDRAGRKVQPSRGARDRAILHDCDEAFEEAGIHHKKHPDAAPLASTNNDSFGGLGTIRSCITD